MFFFQYYLSTVFELVTGSVIYINIIDYNIYDKLVIFELILINIKKLNNNTIFSKDQR